MSQETLNTILAGVAALTGVVGIFLSLRYERNRCREREEDRLLVEEQLGLARYQAEMRPGLVVRAYDSDDALLLTEEPREWSASPSSPGLSIERPPRYTGPGPHGNVCLELSNEGRTAANNVRGWLRFNATFLRPVDPDDLRSFSPISYSQNAESGEDSGMSFDYSPDGGTYTVTLCEDGKPPGTYSSFDVPVVFLSEGKTTVSYTVVCDEGAAAEGGFEIRVPSLEEHAERTKPGQSGLSSSDLGMLKERTWGIICEEWDEDGFLYGKDIYDRLVREGVEVPDYAMIEAFGLLQENRIRAGSRARRSEAEMREDGGMFVADVAETLCDP